MMVPLKVVLPFRAVAFTDFSENFGTALPFTHPSKNQSSDLLLSYRKSTGRYFSKTACTCWLLMGFRPGVVTTSGSPPLRRPPETWRHGRETSRAACG